MKKIFSNLRFGVWGIVRYAIVFLAVIWFANIFLVVGQAMFASIGFWVVAAIVLVVISWISDSNLPDGKKVALGLLTIILMLVVYGYSRGPSSGNRSYLQEACPDCDKF